MELLDAKKEWTDAEAIRTDENDLRTLADAAKDQDLIHLGNGQPVICARDKKNRLVVPDEIMEKHYKELPNGTRSEDGRQAYNGGLLTGFEAMDAEQADNIRRKGQAAQAAAYRQRQSIAQTIDDMLKSAASSEDCERLGLKNGATKQDALVAAMFKEALQKGTVRAADFLRDTVGEQPVNRQQIEADIMTQADKALMERIEKRLGIGK